MVQKFLSNSITAHPEYKCFAPSMFLYLVWCRFVTDCDNYTVVENYEIECSIVWSLVDTSPAWNGRFGINFCEDKTRYLWRWWKLKELFLKQNFYNWLWFPTPSSFSDNTTLYLLIFSIVSHLKIVFPTFACVWTSTSNLFLLHQ